MLIALMIIDAILAILLIVVVILQPGKSAGLGAINGGADALFGGKVKGVDVMLSKATMILACLFAVVNLMLAKLTNG